ncbi:hypothetical protein [Rhizobium sp.]|uniref:hypothetical protein n=1 Tax=Rhizobium sp. TaxID=391 RepID=UPI001838443A
MKVFHFGDIRPHPSGRGTVGAYALHVQCPWRIVSDNTIVTGTSDRFLGAAEGQETDHDDPRSGSLQFARTESLLKGYDDATRSFVNVTDQLVVLAAHADGFGGADLLLSGDCRLQIFPDGSLAEDWRFVELEGLHVVVEGGQVRVDE